MKMKINKLPEGWSEEGQKSRIKELKLFEGLLLNPYFQDDVKAFRSTHKIPTNGFRSLAEETHWEKTYKAPKKQTDLVEEIYSLGADSKPIKLGGRKFKNKISTYNLDLCKILKRYDLSLEWFIYVESYIKSNEQVKINPLEATLTKLRAGDITVIDELSIKLGATMKAEYIVGKFMGISPWKELIEPLQKLMQGYKEKSQRPVKSNLKAQSRIYKLAASRQIKDIANIPNLPSMSPEAVSQKLSRYKKKILPKT